MKYLIRALVLASFVAVTANGAMVRAAAASTSKVTPANTAAATKPGEKTAEKAAATAKLAAEPTAKPAKTAEVAPAGKPMSAWRRAYIAKHHHEPPAKAK